MNPLIIEYFSAIEEVLLQSPNIIAYKVLRKEVGVTDGKLRVRVSFTDKSIAEFFGYATISGGKIQLSKYSFHWQDENGTLRCRWDNAPHHPDLPNAPHHKHNADRSTEGVLKDPDITEILTEIDRSFSETVYV